MTYRSNTYRPANTNAMPDPWHWVDVWTPRAIIAATIVGLVWWWCVAVV